MTEFTERGDGSTTGPNPSPASALQSRGSDLAAEDATVPWHLHSWRGGWIRFHHRERSF